MLIKCPECGHEVSDKAAICPNCGVQIAGRYTVRTTVTNNADGTQTAGQPQPFMQPQPGMQQEQAGMQPQPGMQQGQPGQPGQSIPEPEPKKKNNIVWIIIVAVIVICGGLYFYHSNQESDEEVAYEEAMQSDDVAVLQAYLDEFRDAPQEHRDSIQAHITMYNQLNREWTDVLVSNSRSALQRYLDEHPDSPHKEEAMHKIDSIDWQSALSAGSTDALKSYIEEHPDGDYIDEANDKIHGLNASTVQPEEKQMISSLFRTFFQGINGQDEDRLTSTVNSLLTTFLGKSDATKSDVITFMKKLWKDDVQNQNWHLNDDYKIDKKEVGDNEYEFTVNFSAVQVVQKASGESTQKYKIKAKVNPDGKITEMNMSKVVE